MTTTLALPSTIHQAYIPATRIPVGQRAILCGAEYTNTTTIITRAARLYWSVVMRDAKDAFRLGAPAASAKVWRDRLTGEWVVDYDDRDGQYVEADRCKELAAALGVATRICAERAVDEGLLW